MHSMSIPSSLYFPSSSVNVISIGKLSIGLGNGIGDDGAFIKLTHNKSYFLQDKGNYHRTIIHPPSGLPGLFVNEDELINKNTSICGNASLLFCKIFPSLASNAKNHMLYWQQPRILFSVVMRRHIQLIEMMNTIQLKKVITRWQMQVPEFNATGMAQLKMARQSMCYLIRVKRIFYALPNAKIMKLSKPQGNISNSSLTRK